MSNPRKHRSAAFKAQTVLEALKEATAVAQTASDHHLHPNPVTKWKQEAIAGLPDGFFASTSNLACLACS